MRLRDALVLGRVSNLPTVWSNVLAGAAVGGATLGASALFPLLAGLSLLYVAGMYLNDAFDSEVDRKERPERPIPSGRATRANVAAIAFWMMVAGLAVIAIVALAQEAPHGGWPLAAATMLAVLIVLYDLHHKGNRLGPVVMGGCRALVYLTAGTLSAPPSQALLLAAAALTSYLIGLTYAAKQESLERIGSAWPLVFLSFPIFYTAPAAISSVAGAVLWAAFVVWVARAVRLIVRRRPGDISGAVAALLAGLCLFDALVILNAGDEALALGVAVVLFPLTLALQRWVPAT